MPDEVGSAAWTRALFDAHGRAVRAYVARRAPSADVDDLVVEVFVVAWRRPSSVPPGLDARAYLLGIARRALANHRRGSDRRARLHDRLRQTTPPASEAPDLGAVHDALSRLRPDDQEILRLAAWEELTTSEIAVVIGCSAANAAVRLSRARARLRAALQGTHVGRTSRISRRT